MKKTKIILQLCIAFNLICFFVSCNRAPFWEGQVQPGYYIGKYVGPFLGDEKARHNIKLRINEDKTIEFKETITYRQTKESSFTTICPIHKHVDNVDGQRIVWYSVVDMDNRVWFTLSTDMEYIHGYAKTYQDYSKNRDQDPKYGICILR